MAYRVEYRAGALAYLKRLSRRERILITNRIDRLAEAPDVPGLDVKRLAGTEGWRLRVGKFRVIYDRRDDVMVILVLRVGPRGDVYKG